MAREEDLSELFADLESQADALFEAERGAELADRSRAEYAQVTLASRLMASLGRNVLLRVVGVGDVQGRLARVGDGWCLVSGDVQEWIVVVEAVSTATGVSERSVPELAWSPVTRLGVGSALRRLADASTECVVHLRDDSAHRVRISRVGRDFVEVVTGARSHALVAFASLSAVQRRDD